MKKYIIVFVLLINFSSFISCDPSDDETDYGTYNGNTLLQVQKAVAIITTVMTIKPMLIDPNAVVNH